MKIIAQMCLWTSKSLLNFGTHLDAESWSGPDSPSPRCVLSGCSCSWLTWTAEASDFSPLLPVQCQLDNLQAAMYSRISRNLLAGFSRSRSALTIRHIHCSFVCHHADVRYYSFSFLCIIKYTIAQCISTLSRTIFICFWSSPSNTLSVYSPVFSCFFVSWCMVCAALAAK